LALEGVAKNVATPVPRPETPVEIGRPVQLVSVPDVGVPSAGVVRVGLTACTPAPVPVEVVTPVPPDKTGNALVKVASVAANEVENVLALVMFVPSLNTIADVKVGIATPVPVAFLIVTVSAVSFLTMYCFSIAGTIKFLAPPEVPVSRRRRLRAVCDALVFDSVSVTSALAKVTSPEPVIACSMAMPKLSFVVAPQVPDWSPVPISSIFKSEYVLAMIISLYVHVYCESLIIIQFAFWLSSTGNQPKPS
jgi:hypothetical protein